ANRSSAAMSRGATSNAAGRNDAERAPDQLPLPLGRAIIPRAYRGFEAMPIAITCAGCGKTLKVKDEWAGKKGKCPTCGTTFAIPAAGAASAAPAMAGKRLAP